MDTLTYNPVRVAAETVEISGKVADSRTGETLPGAHIYYRDSTGAVADGTATDINGNYTLTVPLGTNVTASFVGYTEGTRTITTRGVYNFGLVPGVDLPEIEIFPERPSSPPVTTPAPTQFAGFNWFWVAGALAVFALLLGPKKK